MPNNKHVWETGSMRDKQDGKPLPDVIDPAIFMMLATHSGYGAEKYAKDNWKKGQPLSQFHNSFMRHYLMFLMGYTDEPHHIAALWNLHCLIYGLHAIMRGEWPPELNDLNLPSDPFYIGRAVGNESYYSKQGGNYLMKDKNQDGN